MFLNWSGPGAISVANVSNASTTIFMNGSKIIQANFTIIQYTLNVSSGGNGSATPSGETSQSCNASVPISATGNSGYCFANWTGDIASITNPNAAPTNIFMNGSKTIQANFILTPWDLTCDHFVNVLDMIRVGQRWGEEGTPGWIREDVFPDGAINVGDMILIGQYWTGF
jgi:hypothetical protein